MPMFEMRCLHGHARDVFAHTALQRACRHIICEVCSSDMSPALSVGRGLTYFAQGGGGRWIHNLGDQPVYITSTAQHERLMKEQGVTWAAQRRGMPGCWT